MANEISIRITRLENPSDSKVTAIVSAKHRSDDESLFRNKRIRGSASEGALKARIAHIARAAFFEYEARKEWDSEIPENYTIDS